MSSPRSERLHPRRQWLLLFLALFVLGGFNAWSLSHEYRRVEAAEADRLQAAARGLSEIVGQRLMAAERALSTIAGDVAYWRGDGGDQAVLRLQALAGAVDGISTLAILDADGRVIAASRRELIAQDLSTRESFTTASQQPRNRVHLSAPAMVTPGVHTLAMSRALLDRPGGFAGVVVASLDPDYFSAWMDSVRYAPDIWTQITHSDGQRFLSVPPRPEAGGVDIAHSGFSHHRDSGKWASLLHEELEAGGGEEMIALRTVQTADIGIDQALFVAVARKQSLIHAGWRRDAAQQLGLFLAVLSASLFGLRLLQRRQRRIDTLATARLAEQRAAGERLQAIFDILPVGISVTDAAGRIIDCNAASGRLLGIGRAQHLARDCATPLCGIRRPDGSLMPGNEHPAFRALASGVAVFDVEMIVETPNGESWLSVSAVPIGTVQGARPGGPELGVADARRAGVVIAYVDIGSAHRSEADLRKLSRAVEQSAAAVLITDIDGVIEYVNPAACTAYGYAAPELLGANPRRFSSGLTPPQIYQSMWSTILAGGVWRGEIENRRRDGSLLHVALSISPVRDRAGRLAHFVAIQEDLSARVAAERLKDELKTRLGRVERMEVLGAMAGGVAHDFNNILVAILGFSGLGKTVLRAAGGPDRVVRYFEEIETAGERARDLVQQLLVFSRRGPLTLATVAVADVAGEVLGLVASSFPGSVTLSASLADDLPLLDIDRSHLRRVLTNLCLNARDAMDGPGSVVVAAQRFRVEAVEVCASCHTEFAGEFVRISVSDEGHGIAETIRDRIFEPFVTTREVGAGPGMGLAVAHGLIHLYGGHLQISTAPGHGTEIAILLPRSIWHLEAANELPVGEA